MNKLYLLSALVAATVATTAVDSCTMTFTDTADGNYAYTWTFDLDASNAADLLTATWTTDVPTITDTVPGSDGDDTVLCYNDFVYNFSIDDATCATSAGATCTDNSADNLVMYGYGSDSGSDSTFSTSDIADEEAAAVAAIDAADVSGAATTDPYDGGFIDVGSDVLTTSDKNKKDSPTAAAFEIVFAWVCNPDSATDVLTITGGSNNAVIQTASALTVAAVAGLFF